MMLNNRELRLMPLQRNEQRYNNYCDLITKCINMLMQNQVRVQNARSWNQIQNKVLCHR